MLLSDFMKALCGYSPENYLGSRIGKVPKLVQKLKGYYATMTVFCAKSKREKYYQAYVYYGSLSNYKLNLKLPNDTKVTGKIIGSGDSIYKMFCSGFMSDYDIAHDLGLGKRKVDLLIHPKEKHAKNRVHWHALPAELNTPIQLFNIRDDVVRYYDNHSATMSKALQIPKFKEINGNNSPVDNSQIRDYLRDSHQYVKFLGTPSLFPNGYVHYQRIHKEWTRYPKWTNINFSPVNQDNSQTAREITFGRYKPVSVVDTISYLRWKYIVTNPKVIKLRNQIVKQNQFKTKKQLLNAILNLHLDLEQRDNQLFKSTYKIMKMMLNPKYKIKPTKQTLVKSDIDRLTYALHLCISAFNQRQYKNDTNYMMRDFFSLESDVEKYERHSPTLNRAMSDLNNSIKDLQHHNDFNNGSSILDKIKSQINTVKKILNI